ncbi:hypothetical protein TorRG33x02_267850 [Trema orientale]|uniref:Uncharacterized protein n=1 Tax=Trema orientale TaxID=63057 RepID=A0A2P5CZJ5_TREOI|nr:hypothetical protein TorRG33x02_267850 [Trema orientale]
MRKAQNPCLETCTRTFKRSSVAGGDCPRRREMDSDEGWTDEKHLRFLNSMEASFVRTMLESSTNGISRSTRLLRLDRHLPDTSDSTLDLKSQKTIPKHGISSEYTCLRGRMDGRAEKRSRRIVSSEPLNSSQDQVVPQLENREVCDKDDKDHPHVPLTPVN